MPPAAALTVPLGASTRILPFLVYETSMIPLPGMVEESASNRLVGIDQIRTDLHKPGTATSRIDIAIPGHHGYGTAGRRGTIVIFWRVS